MLKAGSKVDKNKLMELENQLKRALADYANLQKRVDEEKKTVVTFANAVLITKFLDILDSLEEAAKTTNSEGLELVIRKFKDVLTGENVKEIPSVGERFNPELHEGVGTVEGERDGEIESVLQKGYTLRDKVLRPARVQVIRARKEEAS
jgi:molecular chaperone GrpE